MALYTLRCHFMAELYPQPLCSKPREPVPKRKCVHLCIWVFCLHECLCTRYMPGACQGQRRASHCLELGPQNVVRHHVGAGRRGVKEVENTEGEF